MANHLATQDEGIIDTQAQDQEGDVVQERIGLHAHVGADARGHGKGQSDNEDDTARGSHHAPDGVPLAQVEDQVHNDERIGDEDVDEVILDGRAELVAERALQHALVGDARRRRAGLRCVGVLLLEAKDASDIRLPSLDDLIVQALLVRLVGDTFRVLDLQQQDGHDGLRRGDLAGAVPANATEHLVNLEVLVDRNTIEHASAVLRRGFPRSNSVNDVLLLQTGDDCGIVVPELEDVGHRALVAIGFEALRLRVRLPAIVAPVSTVDI
mmetsp:Transcript_10727/g.24463  ORF Transcript_10727/g.24463 Transcript_10727/m.24463 type:complete len:268 (+) Transcript_10727:1779-2582(+)